MKITRQPTTGASATKTSVSPSSTRPSSRLATSRSVTGSPSPDDALVASTTPLLSTNRQTAEESSPAASASISWLNAESAVRAASKMNAPRRVPGVAPGMATAKA